MNKIKEYFNKEAENWNEKVKHNPKKIETILDITNLKNNSKILDIGTGTGVLIPYLQKRDPQYIWSIDLADKMIEKAQEKYYKNVTFLKKNFYKFREKDFDYAICFDAYPHFLDKKGFRKRLYKSLKENGRFVIAFDNSKKVINKIHKPDDGICIPIKSLHKEVSFFAKKFEIDIAVDTDEYFILSGLKK